MRLSNFFWGILLILLGGAFLLSNLDVISIDWSFLWKLWPVLLIYWGITFLPDKIKLPAALIFIIGILGLLVYAGQLEKSNLWSESTDNDALNSMGESYQKTLKLPYSDGADQATLNFQGGSGNFIIKEGSKTSLVELKQNQQRQNFAFNRKGSNTNPIANIRLVNDSNNLSDQTNGQAEIKLHAEPNWVLNLDIGAAEADLDFTPFQVDSLTLNAGASEVDLKLGMPEQFTYTVIQTGVSNLEIAVPQQAGCRIETETALTLNNLEDFEKMSDQAYQSANFNGAQKKIFIEMKAGLGKFEINRY